MFDATYVTRHTYERPGRRRLVGSVSRVLLSAVYSTSVGVRSYDASISRSSQSVPKCFTFGLG